MAPVVVRSTTYPLRCKVRKSAWTVAKWLSVVVRVRGSPGVVCYGPGCRAFDDVSVAMQSAENFLDRGVMVACRGARKQVVGQAQSLEVFDDHPVIAVGQLACVRVFRIGLDKNRRAVLV